MTHWFAYTIAASSLVGLACWLLEAGAWRRGWGTRRAWLAGMFGAVCMPLLAWNGLAGVWPGGLLETVRPASLGLVGEALGAAPALPSGLLASAWLAASAVLFLSLAAGLAAGAWRTRRWRETMLDGTPVRVSESVGPAVVGVLRPTIVVPRWVLGAPAAERAMILRHESEHVRAGDPRLLLVGRVLVALMPWNLPLWWMARRLRLAVEVDCDRRVLRHARPDVRAYGALLLTVGRHRPGWVGALAGLARPRSMLEHR
ncbi:MAG: M56 family metallopeptidase, partial [Gemmatimonadetes bacterium]